MKTKILISLLLTAAAPALLHAQGGSLTPPAGVPGPVMKSLDIVEARTPLVAGAPGVTVDGTTGAITITAGGSYYLTGNLTTTGTASCIDVGTHTVSIDLNGFTISRTTGSEIDSAGILISGAAGQKVMIKNGFIVGGGTAAGFANAIRTTASLTGSVHVADVHCSNVRGGIFLNYDEGRNSVRDSSVENSGGEGIRAEIVTGCVVRDTVSNGIVGNSVTNCQVTQQLPTSVGTAITSRPVAGQRGVGVVSNCVVLVSNGGASGIKAPVIINSVARLTAGSTGKSLDSDIAIGCYHLGGATPTIDNKYNMP